MRWMKLFRFRDRGRHRLSSPRKAAVLALAAACFVSIRAPQPLVPVCKLQGSGFSSPFQGEPVRTRGIVFAVSGSSRRGVFIQAPGCDADPFTSDGLFVFLGSRSLPAPGDLVEASGVVQEVYGRTELDASGGEILVLSGGNSLPDPVRFEPPRQASAAGRYFEAHEGMRVALEEALVTGPTDASGRTWIRPGSAGETHIFQDDPDGAGQVFALEDDGPYRIEWGAKVGDRLSGLLGVLDYRGGIYTLQLLAPAQLTAGELPPAAPVSGLSGLTVVTFNLADLFDTQDDPAREDTVLSRAEFERRLEKRARAIGHRLGNPDLIALQEVENRAVLEALLARPEIGEGYAYLLVEGPDRRGLDVALLYRKDRLRVLSYAAHQGCTGLVDGLGPDGNGEVQNPQNALTCDRDGDGERDGNRLFSRPPLVVRMVNASPDLPAGSEGEFWVIVNHWKSKTEDTPLVEYTAPRRLEQARFVAGLVNALPPASGLLVLGDLNDLPGSAPLEAINTAGLHDLWGRLPSSGRYSYIYRGLSQALDYILVRPSLYFRVDVFQPLHINADYPQVYAGVKDTDYRSSDHDPLFACFSSPEHVLHLPLLVTEER